MHINQVKEIVGILQQAGLENKEQQATLLGYVVGLEGPLGLDIQQDPDDKMEWNSFFNDIPGEINEHHLVNLNHAQEVANLTLRYRQAVANASDNLEEVAQQFLQLTGWAFGLSEKGGVVNQLRQVLSQTVTEKREGIEVRRAERQARQAERVVEKNNRERR